MASNSSVEADRIVELIRAEAAKRHQNSPDAPTAATRAPLNLPGVRDLPMIRELSMAAPGATVPAPAQLHVPEEANASGELPGASDVPAPPVVSWWRTVSTPKEQLKQLLSDARKRTDGPRWLPKFMRGLFRGQGRYNRALLDSTALLGKTTDELVRQVRELREAFQTQSEWLRTASAAVQSTGAALQTRLPAVEAVAETNARRIHALIEARRDDEAWRTAITKAAERVPAHDEGISTMHSDLMTLRAVLQPLIVQMQQRLNAAAEQLHAGHVDVTHTAAELRETRWELMNLAEDAAALAAQLDTVRHKAARTSDDMATLRDTAVQQTAGIAQHTTQIGQHAAEIAQQNHAIAQERERLKAAISDIERLQPRIDAAASASQRVDDRVATDLVFIKAQLSRYAAQSDQSAATRGRKQPSKRTSTTGSSNAPEDAQFDAFYLAFENEFRGTRDEIQKRLRAYLPFLQIAEISGKRGGVLDLGCGRGEWIELLQNSGIEQVRGIDLNTSMVEQCTARGLNVTYADAVEHLRSLPETSIEAVTSFHLIEHLPFRVLMQFLREINRVLLPGGLTILETPNPRNILVGASDFFRDMTHNHPIHPDTIRFALEALGFADVRCYFLQDDAQGRATIPQEEYQFPDLQSYVDVPRDFAVIARKG